MSRSSSSVLIGICDDMLGKAYGYNYGRPAIDLPEDVNYPHVSIRTEKCDVTFVIDNPEATIALAKALVDAAFRQEAKLAKRAMVAAEEEAKERAAAYNELGDFIASRDVGF